MCSLKILFSVVSPTVMTKGIGRNRPQSTPIDGIEPPSLVLETSVLPLDEIERWRRSILQPHCCGFQPDAEAERELFCLWCVSNAAILQLQLSLMSLLLPYTGIQFDLCHDRI